MITTCPPSTEAGTSVHSIDGTGRLYLEEGTVWRRVAETTYRTFSELARCGGLERLQEAGLIQTRVLPLPPIGAYLLAKATRISAVPPNA